MKRIGVVGAGAMGSGIAQVAVQAGLEVLLYDIGPEPLTVGLGRVRAGLDRLVAKGSLPAAERDVMLARISTSTELGDFAGVEFVVEAAPELLSLKQKILQELDRACGPEVVLATNTSSLSVTEIGAATGRPDRVLGMHFFNPVPLMKLVEVVRGARTGDAAVSLTMDLTVRLGKTPIAAKDTPGFIVNRVARPYPGEALRLLGDGVATARQIDRIARLGAGFAMGPFELMDLVGMDVNFAVNRSVFEQFFYEPRFRPHPLQAQMVKAGLLGRKTGAGWYRYEHNQPEDGPEPPQFYGQPGPRLEGIRTVYTGGDAALVELVQAAGYTLTDEIRRADLAVVQPEALGGAFRGTALILVDASRCSVTECAATNTFPERVVGYSGLLGVGSRKLIELGAGLQTEPSAVERATRFFQSIGRDTEVVRGTPGLVSARLIACLVNEAAFAALEGVAAPADIDTAMKLGVNYPAGPLEWADSLGPANVLGVLEALSAYYRDDRYRPSSLLAEVKQAAATFYEKGPRA